jgi:hypothetical protein
MKVFRCIPPALALLVLCGCQTDSRQQVLLTDRSQVELRAVQTRAFDTTDRNLTVRTVIATLQDLGFVVDKADEALGTVSGTRLYDANDRDGPATRQDANGGAG